MWISEVPPFFITHLMPGYKLVQLLHILDSLRNPITPPLLLREPNCRMTRWFSSNMSRNCIPSLPARHPERAWASCKKNMDTHLNPYQPKQNKYQNKNNKQLHQVFSAGFLSFKHMIHVLSCALLKIQNIWLAHHRKTILGCTFVRQLCGCQSHVFYFQAPFQWGPLTATKAFGLPWMT